MVDAAIGAAAEPPGPELQELLEVQACVHELQDVIDKYGVSTLQTCLKLVPLARAKGESRAELDLMLDRMDRGLVTNCFVTVNPANKRFPVEIVGTGRIGPRGMEMPAMPEARPATV